MPGPSREVQAAPSLQVIAWEDLLVVVDNGRARPGDYAPLKHLSTSLAATYPGGVGCLTVIPQYAVPPSDESRKAINLALDGMAKSLRCICWLVEGEGFQGAMVQAILTGFRLLGRRPYATHVCTDMHDSVEWLFSQLPAPETRAASIATACQDIQRQRFGQLRAVSKAAHGAQR